MNYRRFGTNSAVRLKALIAEYATLPPMTTLSFRSPLVSLVMGGQHHGVKVDPVSLQRIIAWVDAIGPYRGLEEIRAMPDPDFAGVEKLAIRPRMKSAPDVPRP
jgi:hypothetical protein